MNADARADIVAFIGGFDAVSVLLANPVVPGFAAPVNYPVGDATDIAIGDCNANGTPDVMYANNFGTSTVLRARRNNGVGGLLAPLSSPLPLVHPTLPPLGAVPPFLQPTAIVAGRFDAGAAADVVVASTWSILAPATSNGNCTFTAEPYGGAWAWAFKLRATDFDQDGHLDVAVPHNTDDRYSGAFFGGDLGGFITYDDTELPAPWAGPDVTDLAFGDWNADGFLDVIVASGGGVLYQRGNP